MPSGEMNTAPAARGSSAPAFRPIESMLIPSIPQIYRHVNRWREIVTILSRYGLAGWISRLEMDFVKGILKNRDGQALAQLPGETRIRLALEELGPTFIKLGQIFSTRPDIVGIELAEELKHLQADAPADPADTVQQTVETELGCPLADVFAEFAPEPLASASIGQVHGALLKTGERVVVKVQHAGIRQRVNIDLEMMAALAQLAERIPELALYRPVALVDEFKRALRRELDFLREQRNMCQFARDFENDAAVHIPNSYPEFSTARVLTMERLEGTKLSGFAGGNGRGLDAQKLARRGAIIYLKMIFTRGFYHADPHPGNLVLMEENVIGLMDFGMVGRLDETAREEIEDMLAAIVDHDANHLTAIIMRVGATPAGLDHSLLAVDIADFVDHYGSQPLESFDLSGALQEMVELIRRYHITLPAQLAMLLKVLIMLEGTGRMLSPNFALIELMQPYRRQLLRRRLSPLRQVKKLQRILVETEQLVEMLPRRLIDILDQVQSGKFDVHLDHRGLEPSVNRLALGMITSALFLGSSIMLSTGVRPILFDVSIPGAIGCAVSLLLAFRLLRAISKSGRLDRQN